MKKDLWAYLLLFAIDFIILLYFLLSDGRNTTFYSVSLACLGAVMVLGKGIYDRISKDRLLSLWTALNTLLMTTYFVNILLK